MSDYLSDIAGRSLASDRAVRPRPLSVFEPFQATGVAGSAQKPREIQDYRLVESDAEAIIKLSPIATTGREFTTGQGEARTIAVQPPQPGVSAATVDPQPFAPTIVVQPARQDESRPAEIQSPPEHELSVGTNVPADKSITPVIEVIRNPLGESPDGQRTSGASTPPATENKIVMTSQEPVVRDQKSNAAGTISEQTLHKPAIERAEMNKSVAAQRPMLPIAPMHSPLGTALRNNNSSMQKEHSTPTINVTIGRIEVRATAATVQNQPKPKSPDTLGLDEYLRRRNGGGR